MDALFLPLMKQYGILGIILGFCGWMIHQQVTHSMRRDERKDKMIEDMGDKFSRALDANTQALNLISQSEIRLSAATLSVSTAMDRLAEQDRQEHGKILEYVRKVR